MGNISPPPVMRNTSKPRMICVNLVNCIWYMYIELKDLCELVCVMVYKEEYPEYPAVIPQLAVTLTRFIFGWEPAYPG